MVNRMRWTIVLGSFAVVMGGCGGVDGFDDTAEPVDKVTKELITYKTCTELDGDTVCLTADYAYLYVCDNTDDRARAYARTIVGRKVQPPLYDSYGGGCTPYPALVGSLDSFNVCAQGWGCGSPRYKGTHY